MVDVPKMLTFALKAANEFPGMQSYVALAMI
jgi:hypothetical protein